MSQRQFITNFGLQRYVICMSQHSNVSVPGQFDGSSIMVLAIRGGISDPMPNPAMDDLSELLEDRIDKFTILRRSAELVFGEANRSVHPDVTLPLRPIPPSCVDLNNAVI